MTFIFFLFLFFFIINFRKFFSFIYARFLIYHFYLDKFIFINTQKFVFRPFFVYYYHSFAFFTSAYSFLPFFYNFYFFVKSSSFTVFRNYYFKKFSISFIDSNFLFSNDITYVYFYNFNNKILLIF